MQRISDELYDKLEELIDVDEEKDDLRSFSFGEYLKELVPLVKADLMAGQRFRFEPIEDLNLTTTVKNVLLRYKFRTVQDILDGPSSCSWIAVRGLGPKGLKVIEEAMKEAGFTTFTTSRRDNNQ